MKRDYLFHLFFLSFFVLLLYQCARVLEPFVTPILGAIVLLILAKPMHNAMVRRWPKRTANFHAAMATIIVVSLIVVPFLLILWLLIRESQAMSPAFQSWAATVQSWREGALWLDTPWVRSLQKTVNAIIGITRVQFERAALQAAGQLFQQVGEAGKALARNAVISLVHLFTLVLTLFFLFRDGTEWGAALRRLVPMRAEHKDRLADRLRLTVNSLVRGSVITVIFQSLMSTIAYLTAQIPGAITLGVVTGLAAFIPFVGTALVWVPVGLFLLTQAAYVKGICLLAWCAIVVSSADNLLRATLISRGAQLPMLFLFFGILGGLKLYGLKGLLIGPLLVAIIPVFVEIYRDQYLRKEFPDHIETADDIA